MNPIDYTSPAVVAGLITVVLVATVAIALVIVNKNRRSRALKARFGSEYDLTLRRTHNKNKGEALLAARVERVERLNISPLPEALRAKFLLRWEAVQWRFLDHPRGAVTEADELVNELLMASGYPVAGFEQRAADISVDHARLVESYRRANIITQSAGRNEATTEELRTAMIYYRALFEELLDVKMPETHTMLV